MEMGRAGAGKGRVTASARKGRGPASAGQPVSVGEEESVQMQTTLVHPCFYSRDDL